MIAAGLWLLLLAAPALSAPAGLRVSARVDDASVYAGLPALFVVRVQAGEAFDEPPRPIVPRVPGLEVEYAGVTPSRRSSMTIINGRRTERVTQSYAYRFSVRAVAAGTYTVPPVTVEVGGERRQTAPVTFTAERVPELGALRAELIVDDAEPFLGEPVELRLRLTISPPLSRAGVRVLETPRVNADGVFEVLPPRAARRTAGTAFMGYESAWETRRRDSREGTTVVAELVRTVKPVRPGTVMLEGTDLLAESERSLFRAPVEPVEVRVRELPEEDRPAGFRGLVGRYRVTASAEPREVYVGDPVELSVVVTGPWASELVEEGDLEMPASFGTTIRAAEEVETERLGGRVGFGLVVRPTDASVEAIDPIELHVFNPETEQYETSRTERIGLDVRSARRVTIADAEGVGGAAGLAELEMRSAGEDLPAHLPAGAAVAVAGVEPGGAGVLRRAAEPGWIAALLGPPAVCCGLAAAGAARRRGVSAGGAARRAASAARRDAERAASVEHVASAVRAYLGAVSGRSGGAITPEEGRVVAAPAGDELADEVRELLEACDAARYGGLDVISAEAARERARSWIARAEPALRRAGREA